ncbi:PIG-L deacetylase family protein [Actinoplanes subtropicus]|uniref:PIG-L deacetylase family protein n=1 Tax=Actinoplanes subtropicus TaxID=543632 RepID=UPI0007C49931|nr:PIG-L family deacetylase [Actinoplanes subtropicus]
MTQRFTLVAFHAHPDDESLLTGGTLARAAAEGHRVVLVVATLGEAGGAAGGRELGARREAELHRAAEALGCARVAVLGYRDSGLNGDSPSTAGDPPRFVDVPVEPAAAGLIEILRAERADVLTGYDANGGYGHPDHRHLHLVARYAAAAARTPVLLEATVDRRKLRALLGVMRLAGRLLPRLPLNAASDAYTAGSATTHAVDVRRYWKQKRAGLRAHESQTQGGQGWRTVALLARLPGPLFRLIAGREWFTEVGRRPVTHRDGDVFATLRRSACVLPENATPCARLRLPLE